MESAGSTFPKWQLAILLSAPVAIGLGYMYWRNQKQAIEEGSDEADEKDVKKLKKGNKSISIDGDTAAANGSVKKASTAVDGDVVKSKELTPFEQAVQFKSSGNECFKNGKFDEAIEFYNQAIDICPTTKSTDLSQFYQVSLAMFPVISPAT